MVLVIVKWNVKKTVHSLNSTLYIRWCRWRFYLLFRCARWQVSGYFWLIENLRRHRDERYTSLPYSDHLYAAIYRVMRVIFCIYLYLTMFCTTLYHVCVEDRYIHIISPFRKSQCVPTAAKLALTNSHIPAYLYTHPSAECIEQSEYHNNNIITTIKAGE